MFALYIFFFIESMLLFTDYQNNRLYFIVLGRENIIDYG